MSILFIIGISCIILGILMFVFTEKFGEQATKVHAVLFAALGIGVLVCDFKIGGSNFSVTQIIVRIVVLAIIVIGGTALGIYKVSDLKFEQEQKEKKNKEELEDAFYQKCLSRGIENLDKFDKKSFMIIGKNFGYLEYSQMEEAFNSAKKRKEQHEAVEKEMEAEKQKKIFEANKNFQIEHYFYKEKEKTKITGKEKYVTKLLSEIKKLEKELCEVSNRKIVSPYLSYHESDWSIVGGIASGIAGPIAGAAAAIETQAQNAKHRQEVDNFNMLLAAAGITKESMERSKYEQIRKLEEEITKKAEALEKIKNALIDNEDQLGILKKIHIKHTQKLNEFNLFEFEIEVLDVDNAEILGEEAVIDGSVRIDIKNSKKQLVGCAYYNAEGFDETDLSKVGFKKDSKRTVYGVPNENCDFHSSEEYTFELLPNCLWMIEK